MRVIHRTVVFKYIISSFAEKAAMKLLYMTVLTCFNDSYKLDEFVPDHVLTSGKLIRLKS